MSDVAQCSGGSGRAGGPVLRLVGRCLLALAATAFALSLGELFVRWRYPEYGVPVFTTRLFTEFDPLLGWRKIPNFHGTHVQPEYTIVERFNSKGLRGPEYPYEKPEGAYRILVLGDSFAEGYTVEFEDLSSQLLQRTLNAVSGRPVEVINAATGGYGTDQELLFYRTEGRKYDPDLVIVLYCENDAPMNVKSNYYAMGRGQKPLFELIDGKLSLKSKPLKTWDRTEEAGRDLARNEHDYKHPFALRKPETWYLYRLGRHVLARRRAQDATGAAIVLDEPGPGEAEPAVDAGFRGRQPEWILTEALLAQLKQEVEADGANFLLFAIPQKSDVYDAKPRDGAIEHNLRLLSRRNGLAFIPTVDLFRRRAAELQSSGRRLYWQKDSHWTADGHRLAAEILAQYLLAHQAQFDLPAAVDTPPLAGFQMLRTAER